MTNNSSLVEYALTVLNKGGEGSSAEEMFLLSKGLQKEQAFGYARRILTLARKDLYLRHDTGLEFDQQCAICTYRDVNLPLADRLEQALHILREGRPDLDNSKNPETLGIAGAIYKRKWESDGQKQNLESALNFYSRGYEQGPEKDNGYTGINTAFIHDLLADLETREAARSGSDSENALLHRQEAKNIRTNLVNVLTRLFDKPATLFDTLEREMLRNNWWLLVTIAEAHYGLKNYEAARPWLKRAMSLPDVPEWQLQSTIRQLAQIALLQEDIASDKLADSPAWQGLKELLRDPSDEVAALQTAFQGKVGLALSGGGFRASLYHLGVLAKLAEFDLLRKVEVLSCVSGGSIVGAHYYLELRHLLQTRTDEEITREDYIELVDRISRDFLTGVQRNIRTRVVANWWCNLKMMLLPGYSRTERAGELYEKELFSRVKDGEANRERWLNHLYIYPLDKHGVSLKNFNPRLDNWRRNAKVPVLILNATTLNTGHNWQFTASWMGESPSAIQKVDGNYRLRRMYYKDDGDKKFRRVIRLGHAVAASACVPGMFEPLSLPNLFENKIVRLVDGGVHDNQGIGGLLEQDCSVMLISDASGQMGSLDDPGSSVVGVPLRANDILMERVRNSQYQDMNTRFRAGLLKGFMFIHLKMGLDVQSVDWINCEDPSEENSLYKPTAKLTVYNIRKELQRELAGIRTDLDSFNDTEAYALMTSGYQMTATAYPQGIPGFPLHSGPAHEWFFREIEYDLKRPDTPDELIRLLKVGSERTFKVWRLSAPLRVVAWILLALLVIAAAAAIIHWSSITVITVGEVGIILLTLLLGVVFGTTVMKMIRYRETLIRYATGIGLITVGWIAANIHLLIFDKLYLKKGVRKKPPEMPDTRRQPVRAEREPVNPEPVEATGDTDTSVHDPVPEEQEADGR